MPFMVQLRADPFSRRMSTTERFIKSMAGSIGTQLGRAVIRGILGSLLRR